MKFFSNELSLHNQFNTVADFVPALREILQDRELLTRYGYRLYCEKTISNRPVHNSISFQKTIMALSDPNIKRQVMLWIAKDGPFWDEPDLRKHSGDDYFEYGHQVVTDSSLGEAAFQIASGQIANTVSFRPSDFQLTPLIVHWHKINPPQTVAVPNFWDVNLLQQYLQQQQTPVNSWRDLINRSKIDLPNLTFLDSVLDGLEGEPFSSTIAERIRELLRVLHTLRISFDEQGDRTSEGHEMISNYFHGDNALFSDESDSNKRLFRKELTFEKPDGEEIFCPFHGKIRHRVFRLHFSWPIRYDEPLYIAYIGPKITKK